ncbi:hypothetical protein [Kitasatospora aureofaciens]|uniref:hypothetical protein n=1 Tax=Kitasatospora aureofaciens TaxID=1894 RepID=UPI0036F4983E
MTPPNTTHTPGRTELPAGELDWILDQNGPITLTTGHHNHTYSPSLHATAPGQPKRVARATGSTWHHTIPATDIPALRAWLARLPATAPVRIGTATLADGTGTLLTARAGAQAIRLHQPTNPTTTEETTR